MASRQESEQLATIAEIKARIGELNHEYLKSLPAADRVSYFGDLLSDITGIDMTERLRSVLIEACQLLSVDETAQRLGVQPDGIWRFIRRGRLHAVEVNGRSHLPDEEIARILVTPGGRLKLVEADR